MVLKTGFKDSLITGIWNEGIDFNSIYLFKSGVRESYCTVYGSEFSYILMAFLTLLSPENLLLTADHKTVKLADFGLAREESLTEMMTAETGTYRWMAPEVCFLCLWKLQSLSLCESVLFMIVLCPNINTQKVLTDCSFTAQSH